MKNKIGLLVMAYGTPYREEDIERYYTHIRRGRKPSEEMLQDLKNRYEAIGGISPLAAITEQQAKALEQRLNEIQDEVEFKAYLGLKHIEPFVEDAVTQMKEDGIEEAVSIVLAPHFSTFSVKSYNGRALEQAVKIGGPHITCVESWYDEPKFINYWVERVKETVQSMSEDERNQMVMIVSAHSLPEKILLHQDPYPEQIRKTGELIAQGANIANWEMGWQSAGNTPEPWLGPDVQDLTKDLYDEYGYKAFMYLPVGFVSEHLEVLYDNDYECKVVTDKCNVSYYRPSMPNVHEDFIDAMATVVLQKCKVNA
ncbi:ferrochelatase [Bacillus massiliigorillae]|uniref:ferrochelatase n=1 Tax=Bacillus massiliigorillae TaxID=1243664 RepID=UPI0003A8BC1E|nr:ferrochelatase [Bacillus massiliigorillae]